MAVEVQRVVFGRSVRRKMLVEPTGGLEPPTFHLQGGCSTAT